MRKFIIIIIIFFIACEGPQGFRVQKVILEIMVFQLFGKVNSLLVVYLIVTIKVIFLFSFVCIRWGQTLAAGVTGRVILLLAKIAKIFHICLQIMPITTFLACEKCQFEVYFKL